MREKIGVLLKAPYRLEKKGWLERKLYKICPAYMKKRLVGWSFARRHKREWQLRYLVASVLVAGSVTLAGTCITIYPSFLQDAKNYSPYDMVYSEIFGRNQVPVQRIMEILKENGVAVEQNLQISYIRNSNFNCFPVTEVNRCFGCDYEVEEGQFLNLFQYDLTDGYEHERDPIPSITLAGNEKLYSAGSDVKILFNKNPAFADRTLLVSDADFERMKTDMQYWPGIAHLFLFEQWEDSYAGVCAVEEYLKSQSQTEREDAESMRYCKVSSKAENYQDAGKSGQFLLFLMAFVIGLMLAAEFLLIHARIQSEQEETRRAVYSLHLLGMTEGEIIKCLNYKNGLRFIPPLVAGALFSILPSYVLNGTYGAGRRGVLAGSLFAAVILAGALVLLGGYSNREFQKSS